MRRALWPFRQWKAMNSNSMGNLWAIWWMPSIMFGFVIHRFGRSTYPAQLIDIRSYREVVILETCNWRKGDLILNSRIFRRNCFHVKENAVGVNEGGVEEEGPFHAWVKGVTNSKTEKNQKWSRNMKKQKNKTNSWLYGMWERYFI
jgi:hypothetical protein